MIRFITELSRTTGISVLVTDIYKILLELVKTEIYVMNHLQVTINII